MPFIEYYYLYNWPHDDTTLDHVLIRGLAYIVRLVKESIGARRKPYPHHQVGLLWDVGGHIYRFYFLLFVKTTR